MVLWIRTNWIAAIAKSAIGFFVIMFLVTFALADDYMAAIGAGGLELLKSKSISMESEDLTISKEKIKVKYVFHNESDQDTESIVAFPLPPIQCGHFDRRKALEGFQVRVNGVLIQTKKEIKAYEQIERATAEGGPHAGKEISEQVRRAGLPLNCLEVANNPKLLKQAQEMGLATDSINDPIYFKYQSAIQYYWTQRFPAKSHVTIEHEYRPIVGMGVSGLHYPNEFNLNWSKDIHIHLTNDEHKFKQSDIDSYEIVNFVLTTAKSWAGPIKHFKLTIIGNDKDEYIGSSLGPLNAIGPNRYQVVKSDFHPKEELVVIFGRGRAKARPVR